MRSARRSSEHPAGPVSRIVSQHLARRANPLAHSIPAGTRPGWSVKLRLTAPERRELERRAAADGRTLSNYVTVLALAALAGER
jgi:hypothetical protein